jgi:hypothetical protein
MDRASIRTVIVAVCLAATALTGLGGPAAATSDPTAFSMPRQIVAGRFRDVSMAVDPKGHLHIAAIRGEGTLVYLTDRSGRFVVRVVAAPVPAGGEQEPWETPSLALDEHSRVSIAAVRVSAGTGCGCTEGVFLFSDRGRTRGTFPVTGKRIAGRNAHDPTLKTVDGRIHLVFRRGDEYPETPPPGDGEIWYRTNASGSWTSELVAGPMPGSPVPVFRLGEDGTAWVAWSTGKVHLASNATISGGFQSVVFPESPSHAGGLSMAMASWDRPQVSLSDDDTTYLQTYGLGDGGVVPVMAHGGQTAITLDTGDREWIAAWHPWDATGLWVVRAFGSPMRLATGRIDSAAMRAPSSGGVVVIFARTSLPRGLYLSRR